VPEISAKRRKRGGDLYWVSCPTCEYTGPACDDERAARTWWNKNLTGRMDSHTWRRIDCVPTDVLEKLLELASSDVNDSSNWLWSELSLVLGARKRISELERELADLGRKTWFKQAELTSSLAVLRKTATHVTPAVFDWMIHTICKKFMEGE